MKKAKGNIKKTNKDGSKETEELFTYSEEEKQQNRINKETAKFVFTPEFIPFYPEIQKKYKLLDKEAILYGFIRYYLKTSKSGRFYFSNEQLAELLDVSERYVSELLKGLQEKMKLPIKYKVKAGGGTIRFINVKELRLEPQFSSDLNHSSSLTRTPVLPNNNKINNNKINEKKENYNKRKKEPSATFKPTCFST